METFRLWGAIVNALAIIGGALVGLLLRRLMRGRAGSTNQSPLSDAIFKSVGLCILLIGIDGAIKGAVNGQIAAALQSATVSGQPLTVAEALPAEQTLVIILSMVLGTVLGTLCHLDDGITYLGQRVEAMTRGRLGEVASGFVSASLLFCVGSMAIVGPLNSGLLGDHSMQYTKALLDMISAIVFASSLGFGVLFSSVCVLIFQGSVTLLASWIAPYLTPTVIVCMTGTGSLLIIALALNLLGLTKLKIMNMMPAVFLPILLIPLFRLLSF